MPAPFGPRDLEYDNGEVLGIANVEVIMLVDGQYHHELIADCRYEATCLEGDMQEWLTFETMIDVIRLPRLNVIRWQVL